MSFQIKPGLALGEWFGGFRFSGGLGDGLCLLGHDGDPFLSRALILEPTEKLPEVYTRGVGVGESRGHAPLLGEE